MIVPLKQYVSFVVHKDTIYYHDGSAWYCVSINGGDHTALDTNISDPPSPMFTFQDMLCIAFFLPDNPDTLIHDSGADYFAADISDEPDSLSFDRVSDLPTSGNGLKYFTEPIPPDAPAPTFTLYAQKDDTSDPIEIVKGMGNSRYITTQKYIFYINLASKLSDHFIVKRTKLDGSEERVIVDDSVPFDMIFCTYDEEWIYCVADSIYVDEGDVFRFHQETGEIQEIHEWNLSPFDVWNGYIYGFDNEQVDIVRMQLDE